MKPKNFFKSEEGHFIKKISSKKWLNRFKEIRGLQDDTLITWKINPNPLYCTEVHPI